MIASDGQVDIFEFMLQKVLERHLDAHYAPKGAPKIRYTRHMPSYRRRSMC